MMAGNEKPSNEEYFRDVAPTTCPQSGLKCYCQNYCKKYMHSNWTVIWLEKKDHG